MAGAVLRAVLSFAYWSLVYLCFYGAVAGDRRATAPAPTLIDTYAVPVAIIVIAIIVHAALSLLWSARSSGRLR